MSKGNIDPAAAIALKAIPCFGPCSGRHLN